VLRFRVGRERRRNGENGSKCLTAVKGKTGLPQVKEYPSKILLFPLTFLRLRLSAKSVKIGASEDFLRTSEARSLQRFSRSFRKKN
jgi:hypothetical protein